MGQGGGAGKELSLSLLPPALADDAWFEGDLNGDRNGRESVSDTVSSRRRFAAGVDIFEGCLSGQQQLPIGSRLLENLPTL